MDRKGIYGTLLGNEKLDKVYQRSIGNTPYEYWKPNLGKVVKSSTRESMSAVNTAPRSTLGLGALPGTNSETGPQVLKQLIMGKNKGKMKRFRGLQADKRHDPKT